MIRKRTFCLAAFRIGIALALGLLFTNPQFNHLWAQSPVPGGSGVEPNRVTATVNPALRAAVKGHLPRWARQANDAGVADPRLHLDNLTVVLKRSDAMERSYSQLLQEQQDPDSPQYHRWLKPQEIGDRFGVSQHDIAAVTNWLQSQGLRVDGVSKSKLFITFSGSTHAVATALSTEFHYYEVKQTQDGVAQIRRLLSINEEPTVPTALAPVIHGFSGLSEIPLHPMVHTRAMSQRLLPQFSNCDTSCEYFVTPADFATIFDINAVYNNGINGTGEKMAIIGRSRVANSDVEEYEQLTGLPTKDPTVVIPPSGTDPGTTQTGDQAEATLDVDRAIGTAPGANIDLVVSSDSQTQSGISVAAEYEVDTLLDPIMNLSFGACEQDAGAAGVDSFDALAKQAAGEGISIFVSSGDSGAAGCDSPNATPSGTQQLVKSPNYLCSTSYVTCVGGTEFNDAANPGEYWSSENGSTGGSALSYIPEGGWNEPTSQSGGTTTYIASASGGGVSSIIAKPSWQTGTGVPNDGFRDTPDVAFPAAGHDGYFGCLAFAGGNCNSGDFVAFSGTSAAAPSMAGVMALVDQKMGGGQGNANPKLYSIAASSPDAFHDARVATSGVADCSASTPSMCNNSTPSATGLSGGLAGYLLTAGYDQVTGLGSIDVVNLANAFGGARLKLAPTAALTASALSISTAQTVTFTVKVSGSGATPTGTVQFVSNGSNLGSAVTLNNGAATSPAESFSAVGTYTITAQYSGDSNYDAATTSPTNLSVTSPPPPTFAISAPALTINATGETTGNTDTVTVTGQNGFSGTVALTCTVAFAGTGTANDPPTCSLSNNGSVALSSSTTSASVTATLATTAATSAMILAPFGGWMGTGGALLACLLLLPAGFRRRYFVQNGRRITVLWGLLLLAVVASLAGCGGGSNSSGGGSNGPTNPGTSTGAYTVTISGSGSSTNASTTFTLTVN